MPVLGTLLQLQEGDEASIDEAFEHTAAEVPAHLDRAVLTHAWTSQPEPWWRVRTSFASAAGATLVVGLMLPLAIPEPHVVPGFTSAVFADDQAARADLAADLVNAYLDARLTGAEFRHHWGRLSREGALPVEGVIDAAGLNAAEAARVRTALGVRRGI